MDIKCLVLDFQVKNNGSQTEQIDIYNFILESQAWKNGINLAAFMALNQENTKASLSPLLEPGGIDDDEAPLSHAVRSVSPVSVDASRTTGLSAHLLALPGQAIHCVRRLIHTCLFKSVLSSFT